MAVTTEPSVVPGRLRWRLRSDRAISRWGPPVLVAAVAVAAIVSRRPDAVTNPQFWAEDGNVWFAQALRFGGFHALFIPQAGYLQTSSRLVAWIAQAFPPGHAPLVYNLFGIALQALPAVLLATRRLDRLIPDWRVRALLIVLYLGLPNSAEVNATVTNSQWHLALVLPLLAFASPPTTWPGRIVDGALFLVAALSGPYCLVAAPFLLLYRWKRGRGRWLSVLLALDLLGSAVQLAELLASQSSRHTGLSADMPLLARVVGSQLFVALGIGQRGAGWLNGLGGAGRDVGIALALGLGTGLVLAASIRGPLELRLFIGYAFALLASALGSTMSPTIHEWWMTLAEVGKGQRYFVVPMAAVGAALAWLAGRRPVALRVAAAVPLLVILAVGVPLDWRHPPYIDFHYRQRMAACLTQPAGTTCTIPINPVPLQVEVDRSWLRPAPQPENRS